MMTKTRTVIDANVLIAICSGQHTLFEEALGILEDPARTFIVSDALWLEVMPKAIYHEQREEVAFYESVFVQAEYQAWSLKVTDSAKHLAQTYGLAAMDAIHVAVALTAGADEFITGEKPGKPMFRVKEISIRSLWRVS